MMPGLSITAPPVFMVSIRAAKIFGDTVVKSEHGIMLCKGINEDDVERLSLVRAGSNWPLGSGWRRHGVVTQPISVETVIRSLKGNLFAASVAAIRVKKEKESSKVEYDGNILLLPADKESVAASLAQFRAMELWPERSGWRHSMPKALRLSEDCIESILCGASVH